MRLRQQELGRQPRQGIESEAVGGGRAGYTRTPTHSFVEAVQASISFVGNGIMHLVLITSDEEA